MDTMAQESKNFVVFFCKSCRLPLGDSTDWDGHVTEKAGFVHLTAVSEHILCSGEPVVSSFPEDEGCVLQILECKGCMSSVGRIYLTTKHLDSKADVFLLNMSALTIYTPASAKKQVLPQCDAPVTLKKCVEYDEEVKKLEHLSGSLQRKIYKLERKASS